ncbi:MAG: universal stress protein [Pseudomonadota bacterium]
MNNVTSPSPAAPVAGPATPPRRILVATDLSARSDRAIARGATLARDLGAKLTVAHIIDADLPDMARAAAIKTANACLEASPTSDQAELVIREGEDYRDILAAADALGADLLVLGRHRNEDGTKPLGGTTLDRVVRFATIPVLLAADPVVDGYSKVLAGIDLSIGSLTALQVAKGLAPGAEVHAMHAYDVPFAGFQTGAAALTQEHDSHADALKALLSNEIDHERIVTHLVKGDPVRILRDGVKELAPDLIAIGTNARTGLARAIVGSLAENLLSAPPCDVLVVNPGARVAPAKGAVVTKPA